MNLKESFRYQNFLDKLMTEAGNSIADRDHCLSVTKHHLRSKANPDAEDIDEVVETGEFYKNDDVICFMLFLVNERDKLTNAIGRAKSSISFDIDAAIETNKFRQTLADRIKLMLMRSSSKKIERGVDFKFNNDGNQMQYYYDIELESVEAFDRAGAKSVMRIILLDSDKVSREIDASMINTNVEYEQPFNVNDSFDDVMEQYLAKILMNDSPDLI